MPSRVRVKIDLARLKAHLSREEGRPLGDEQVLQWLHDAGFISSGEGYWIVAESDLGHLDPSEVLEIARLAEGN
ncbi:hypothetical protein [Fontivita pretiosa]|uniref:hypothetical protein n=1 Tax=Fontivita pretiosa TaxID=2989684 RepID=UPI003D185ED8